MMATALETDVQNTIRIALSKVGARLFRNQVGSYELKDGRWISSGLCVGSSDLIGWTPVEVTPAMVGKKLAVFTAIEVKRLKGKKATDEQDNFIRAVVAAGGIAGVARSEAEALALIESAARLVLV